MLCESEGKSWMLSPKNINTSSAPSDEDALPSWTDWKRGFLSEVVVWQSTRSSWKPSAVRLSRVAGQSASERFVTTTNEPPRSCTLCEKPAAPGTAFASLRCTHADQRSGV